MSLLAERQVSSFPLSIGTAFALERFFEPQQARYDPSRSVLPLLPLPESIWINVTTLLRNIAGAVTKKTLLIADPSEFYNVAVFEMEFIASLFRIEGNNRCTVHFYFSHYVPVYKKQVAGITLRQTNTPAQQFLNTKLDQALSFISQRRPCDVTVWDDTVTPANPTKSIMLTHVVYDLFAWPVFRSLTLLESHTGTEKPRTLWYTKYHPLPGNDLRVLPLDHRLLKLFGDKVLYSPAPRVLRERVLEIAIARHWTPLTTAEKVRFYLERDITDADDHALILRL